MFVLFTKAVYVMGGIFLITLRKKHFGCQIMLKNGPAISDRGSET